MSTIDSINTMKEIAFTNVFTLYQRFNDTFGDNVTNISNYVVNFSYEHKYPLLFLLTLVICFSLDILYNILLKHIINNIYNESQITVTIKIGNDYIINEDGTITIYFKPENVDEHVDEAQDDNQTHIENSPEENDKEQTDYFDSEIPPTASSSTNHVIKFTPDDVKDFATKHLILYKNVTDPKRRAEVKAKKITYFHIESAIKNFFKSRGIEQTDINIKRFTKELDAWLNRRNYTTIKQIEYHGFCLR